MTDPAVARLPIASAPWYGTEEMTATVTCITEPFTHSFVRANIWHVRGTTRDLVVDATLGVVSLRDCLPELFDHDPVLVISHAHLDHVGCAHEFTDRRMHPAERDHLPVKTSLHGERLAELLGNPSDAMPPLLIDALPHEDYRIDDYGIPELTTSDLSDGERLDLGDSTWTVVHLPGHTPGSIGLFNEHTGEFFSGDVIYDGKLLDDLHESNVEDYLASLTRLRELPVTIVYPGHDGPFGRARLHELIDAYLNAHRSGGPQ